MRRFIKLKGRNGEWAKHLRTFGKRIANKKSRKFLKNEKNISKSEE